MASPLPRTQTTSLSLTLHVTADVDRIPSLTDELVGAISRVEDVTEVTVRPELFAVPRTTDLAPLRIDVNSRRTSWRGQEIRLTRLEFDLLVFLCRRPGQVHRRRALMTEVWHTTYVSERTVDVHVRRLRCKTDPEADLIRTVRGVGYQLADPTLVSIVG